MQCCFRFVFSRFLQYRGKFYESQFNFDFDFPKFNFIFSPSPRNGARIDHPVISILRKKFSAFYVFGYYFAFVSIECRQFYYHFRKFEGIWSSNKFLKFTNQHSRLHFFRLQNAKIKLKLDGTTLTYNSTNWLEYQVFDLGFFRDKKLEIRGQIIRFSSNFFSKISASYQSGFF